MDGHPRGAALEVEVTHMLGASLHAHSGHDFGGHSWWGFWGWFVPMLLILALVVVAVWALARNMRGGLAVQTTGAAPPLSRTDPALEQARLRYARGEIRREEFLRFSRDLGESEGEEERPGGDRDS